MLALILTWCHLVSAAVANEQVIPEYGGEIKIQGSFPDVVISPLPSETVNTEDLPVGWDWREKGGVLSTDLNQHIPV